MTSCPPFHKNPINKMAFVNLFSGLSAIEEDRGQPTSTYRHDTDSGRRGNARKRKTQGGQAGPYKTKQRYQVQTTRIYSAAVDDSQATHHHVHNTDGASITTEEIHNPNYKGGNINMCHKGQSYQAKNHNVEKQREQKKTEGQKKSHQQKDRPAYRGGSHQTGAAMRKGGRDRKNTNNQDFNEKHTRFMTQEFKDQNVLMADGRLLCRHFLFGRCIKGDDCQLEHVQGCNDLIKELCKFYVQGLCTKGRSCLYMHKSFPCKFFHRKGKCSQGADCRFSHEPLNDITSQLLDEALKRENDLYELTNKAEQKSSGQPGNTDEFVILETNRTPDIFLQPLRPNFYKSTDTSTEKEASFCPTDKPADSVQEVFPPCASDAAQCHSPPSINLNPAEPVCYSVEAVLGPQLSRSVKSLFPTPKSREFTPLSSSDCTSDFANQTHVPYSVDAVLRSCKSRSLPPHTSSSTSKACLEEVSYPLLSPEMQNKKVLCSSNTINEANESQESLPLKRPFHSLLTSSVTKVLQPTDDSKSTQCPQGSIQSSCPARHPADCRSSHVKTLEPDKASARSFSLFAAPLSITPLPFSSPQSVENPSHSLDSKQRASNLEFCLLSTSLNFSPSPKMGKHTSADHMNPPPEQLKNLASSTTCGDTHKQLPGIPSHTEEITANSIFKSLFVCLNPYQQDGEQEGSIQISVPSGCISECEKDKNGTQQFFMKQQRKKNKGGQQKKLMTDNTHKQSTKKVEHRPSPRISQNYSKATGLLTLNNPEMLESQMKDSGTRNFPFKPVMPQNIQPRLKHTLEGGKCVNTSVAATPIKDLFKNLDTAVFHTGH